MKLKMKMGIREILQQLEKNNLTTFAAFEYIEQLKRKSNRGGQSKQGSPLTGRTISPGNVVTRTFTYDEPYLRDHQGNNPFDDNPGSQVLLGVTHGSLAVEAARLLYPEASVYHIHKLVIANPVVLYPGEMVDISISTTGLENHESTPGKIFFTFRYKKSSGQRYQEAASGQFVLDSPGRWEPAVPDIFNFRDRCKRWLSSEEIYDKKESKRGPLLKTLRKAWIFGTDILGELELTREMETSGYHYHIHPALLDGAFISSLSGLPGETSRRPDPTGAWIPFMIKDVYVYGPLPAACFCYSQVVKATSEVLTVDIHFINESQQVLLVLKGFTYRYTRYEPSLTGSSLDVNQAGQAYPVEPGQQISSSSKPRELEREIETYLANKLAAVLGENPQTFTQTKSKNKNFMDLGVDSNNLVIISREIEKELGLELYPTLFFEYQDIKELAKYFMEVHQESFSRYLLVTPPPSTNSYDSTPQQVQSVSPGLRQEKEEEKLTGIAVIGLAGRFAGSGNLDEFWENLRTGRDLITEVPPDHWDWQPWFDENRSAPNKTYCKWGSFIEVDTFDSLFFGITPREAVWMDPQLRILLEVVHTALEDAGYGRTIYGSNTGVFVGTCLHEYWDEIVRANTPIVDYQANSVVMSSLSGRISYTFDLQGESIPVDNACASSLTAIHLACRALQSNECELAIAAGANVLLSPLHYVYSSRAQALSPTGRCLTFDKAADGYVPGEGVAALLLKPLGKAVLDKDHIHAVIKGTAANHVGKSNNPTAPRPELQEKLLLKAWENAGIDPGTITYIEAHGTGTELGDPVEINALKKALNRFTNKRQFCAIGSAKAHIGHLEGAAGIAGVIKTILSMKYKQIPAMPFFNELNPYITLEDSPFFINTELQSWETRAGVPRRAGVSSFGITGNNVHVVLEEYIPPQTPEQQPVTVPTPAIFILSGANEERLMVYAREMLAFLEKATAPGEASVDTSPLRHHIREALLRMASSVTAVDESHMKLDEAVTEYGFDAVNMADFIKRVNETYHLDLNPIVFSRYPSLELFSHYLQHEHGDALADYYKQELEPTADKDDGLQYAQPHTKPLNLAKVTYTLQVGRQALEERLAIVVHHMDELKEKLRQYCRDEKNIQGLYRGNETSDKEKITLLIEGDGDDLRVFVENLVSNRKFHKLARLWVSGVEIDWKSLYRGGHPHYVSLPTYVFAWERYRIPVLPGGPAAAVNRNVEAGTGGQVFSDNHDSRDNRDNSPVQGLDFLYLPLWQPISLSSAPTAVARPKKAPKAKVLIIYSSAGAILKDALAKACTGDEVVEFHPGNSPGFESLSQQLDNLREVYFLGGIRLEQIGLKADEDDLAVLEESQERGVRSLLRLVRFLGSQGVTWKPLQLKVVTNDVCPAPGGAVLNPYAATLHGMIRSMAYEYPRWEVSGIDISGEELNAARPGSGMDALVKQILAEPGHVGNGAEIVAVRGGTRYCCILAPLLLPPPMVLPFKRQGVYLVVGGAGGIGLELSLYLAKTVQARLILVGRSPLEESQQEKISRIESMGGKVLYIQADVTDLSGMKSAVKHAKTTWNIDTINGVIHAAVVVKNQTLENMDEETLCAGLAPKVRGSVVIHRVMKDEPLDFLLFFSSSQSFISEAGMSGYVAGNCFQDAFAHYLDCQGNYPVKTINWGYWHIPAVSLKETVSRSMVALGLRSFSSDQGIAAMEQVLANPVTQVVTIQAEPRLLKRMRVAHRHRLRLHPSPRPSLIETAVEADKQPVMEPEVFLEFEQAHEELDRASHYLLLEAFQRMGVFRRAGEYHDKEQLKRQLKILPDYYRLFESLLNILEKLGVIRFGSSGTEVVTTPELEKPELQKELKRLYFTRDRLLSAYPQLKTAIHLLWVCTSRYPGILSGTVPATDVMFPNSSMELVEGLYKGNKEADYYNHLVIWSLLSYIRAWIPLLKPHEKVRILEVGAGTGGTSAPVLEALRTYGQQLHYVYTDISMAFTRYGQDRYGAENPFLEFKVLDIEKDVRIQGFEPGYFDVIIGANVVHATVYLRKILARLKGLLKIHGWLILSEGTRSQDYGTVMFGLLEGWWLYKDEENRLPGCPLLAAGTWERILKEEGFPRVVILGQQVTKGKKGKQHVIIAESDGLVRQEVVDREPGAAISSEPVKSVKQAAHKEIPRPTALQGQPPLDPGQYMEEKIIDTLAAVLQMDKKKFRPDVPYADFGVDSILAIEIVNRLNENLGINLRSTDLFNYTTTRKLSNYIIDKSRDSIIAAINPVTGTGVWESAPGGPVEAPGPVKGFSGVPAGGTENTENTGISREDESMNSRDHMLEGIAVIGMSGRFPDARDLDEFWQNLEAGKNSIREVTRWDSDSFYDPDPERADKSYCKWGAFLSDIDKFDPLFFNISPKEAEMMDPQQRLFLEQAWKALEDAGYSDRELEGKKCGVFVGFNGRDYHRIIEKSGLLPDAYQMTGNYEALLPARISYFLNLRGPAITVNTACSASLVAVHLACESIYMGTSELAIAGGVSILGIPDWYILLCRTGVFSPGDRCRAFDDRADGIVPGEGIGVVLLKRLDQALEDGDHIYGVIIGTGINQDGKSNGITAPSAPSQTALECEIYDRNQIDPAKITYIEAHGTGTRLGDPIEIHALTDAFRKYTQGKQFCAVGTVKTNIGHSMAAAGIAGLIKVLLCLNYKKLVPTLNFEKENEMINFKDSPFYANTRFQDWKTKNCEPRLAAVSSFGFSGTNAHVVLREAPRVIRGYAPLSVEQTPRTPHYFLIPISAKTPTALEQKWKDLGEWLDNQGDAHRLKDISYTLLNGRSHFVYRSLLVVENTCSSLDLAKKIQALLQGKEVEHYFTNIPGADPGKRFKPDPNQLQQGETAIKELQETQHSRSRYKEKLQTLADLYIQRYDLDWHRLFAGQDCRRISLPTYPFAKQRCWVPGTEGHIRANQAETYEETGTVEFTDEQMLKILKRIESGELEVPQADQMLNEVLSW